MNRNLGKKKMKATESAPMRTKQENDGSVRNQTTNVPTNRFPWTTIIMIVAFIILIVIIISFLEFGSAAD